MASFNEDNMKCVVDLIVKELQGSMLSLKLQKAAEVSDLIMMNSDID